MCVRYTKYCRNLYTESKYPPLSPRSPRVGKGWLNRLSIGRPCLRSNERWWWGRSFLPFLCVCFWWSHDVCVCVSPPSRATPVSIVMPSSRAYFHPPPSRTPTRVEKNRKKCKGFFNTQKIRRGPSRWRNGVGVRCATCCTPTGTWHRFISFLFLSFCSCVRRATCTVHREPGQRAADIHTLVSLRWTAVGISSSAPCSALYLEQFITRTVHVEHKSTTPLGLLYLYYKRELTRSSHSQSVSINQQTNNSKSKK